jgi:hypothetical protein
MTPEILLVAPVLILITIVIALLMFSEGPWSNMTASVKVRVDDTRRRGVRSIQRDEEDVSNAREQDRNFLLIVLLTIFAILFSYAIGN